MSYREDYERRKKTFLEPKYIRTTGTNAAWCYPLLNYRSYDWWYIPGGARAPVHSADYEKNVKINFRETDSKKFADSLIDATKKDFAYWKYKVADIAVDKDYSEVVVYVYETNSFFCSELGYKYRYFFIRQEPFLKFYSMLYNETIYEGFKEELVSILEKEHKLLATASFYWKE